MLKKIAVAFVLILVALAGYIATRPSEFRISRARTVAAPPDVVYAYVNDFHKWPEWSPWEKLDPAMKKEVSGAPAGAGAVYLWSGNDQVGEGRMTITDSRAPQSVTIRAFSLFMDMDKMVGPDFDRGLANLDAATAAAVKRATPAAAPAS
jgi:hypothetical protein